MLPHLSLTPPTDGFPWYDLCKILHGGHGMAKVHRGEEMLPNVSTLWKWGALAPVPHGVGAYAGGLTRPYKTKAWFLGRFTTSGQEIGLD